jgi:uncharacterized protein YgiM (DUF1202 family)
MSKKMIRCISIGMLGLMLCVTGGISTKAAAEENNTNVGKVVVASEYQPKYVKVSSGNLNVRSGPGTNYKIVGKLKNGTKLLGYSVFGKIDSEGYGWTSIRAIDINGKEVSGWVRNDFLTWNKP